MSVPERVRDELRQLLRGIADEMDWSRLPPSRKSLLYEQWSRDPSIGGVLARYIDSRRIRVYIKDTLLKDYFRARSSDSALPLRTLGIGGDVGASEEYIKPHGRLLSDGRIVCWGKADDWKAVVMAVYERTYQRAGRRPYGAVLLGAVGRYGQDDVREMVENAASKLGVERVAWV